MIGADSAKSDFNKVIQPSQFADSNMIGICTFDFNGRVLEANEYVAKLSGYSLDEIRKGHLDWIKATPPEQHGVVSAAIHELRERGVCTPFEIEHINRSGVRVPILIGGSVLNDDRQSGICFVVDITALREAHTLIREGEERFRALSENASVGVIEANLDLQIRFANLTGLAWFGAKSLDEVIGRSITDFISPESLPRVRDQLRKRLAGEPSSYEVTLVSKGGQERNILVSGSPIRDQDGKTKSMIATFLDITPIRNSVTVLETTVEAVPDGILVFNEKDDNVIAYNRKFLDIWHVPEDLITRRSHEAILAHCMSTMCEPEVLKEAREKNFSLGGLSFEKPFELKDGRFVEVTSRVANLGPAEQVKVVCVRDVTEKKKVEERLLHADRMTVVGTLAAGIAHEINNPLTHLVCGLELISKDLETSALKTDIDALLRSAGRIADIVKDLKVFSRSSTEQVDPVDIISAFEATLPMVNNEIKRRTRFETNFSPAPLVMANEGRLGQIFLNLLVNSLQALRFDDPTANLISVTTRTDARGYACVEVSDNGQGIAKEHLRQVFEPFFTTKKMGSGTGLGLSICYTIVQRFHGEIEVESELGVGTKFSVRFPPAPSMILKSHATSTVRSAPSPRRRILVIDDEPSIGEVIHDGLEDEHDVTYCDNGVQAEKVLRENPHFDLILCDLTMPILDGMELFNRIRISSPHLVEKFVFMTGGAVTPAACAFLEAVQDRVLYKPFTLSMVRSIVEKIESHSG